MSDQIQTPVEVPVVPPSWDPFQIMDRLDEEAFRRELDGIASTDLVYVVREAGREVVGLSKTGVDECCMALVSQGQVIREEELSCEILGEGDAREALFKVKAARYAVNPAGGDVRLDQVIGVKRQPLYFDGERLNPHWYEAGAMKAARNARFRLIPGNVRAQVIAAARTAGQERVVNRDQPAATAGQSGEVVELHGTHVPTEKQAAFFRRLVASPVFTEAERSTALDWLARKATRQSIKSQIDWLKRQVETRAGQGGSSAA